MLTRQQQSLHLLTLLLLTAVFPACTKDPYFSTAPTYIAYKEAPASTLNRAWLSGSSMYTLQQMRFKNISSPDTINERIATAEHEVSKAKKWRKSAPERAASHYLKASEILWPVVRDHAKPDHRAYWGDKKRLIIGHQLYTHAVGQTAQLMLQTKRITGHQSTVQLGGSTLKINSTLPHTLHPSFFDYIWPVDTHRYGNVGPSKPQTGLGAALVAHRIATPRRKILNPLIPPTGMDIPVNAIIDYPEKGKPRLTLTNLLKTDSTSITGQARPLQANYSATLAATMSNQSSLLGLLIAIKPEKMQEEKGLFALGPYDPDKIPVIFVHGLISQPSTWTKTSNRLLQDKTIRENYQIYYYFYPTGVTPIISGAEFRETLNNFYTKHGSHSNAKLNRTVLVGHSMGGILSSIQSRKFGQSLWDSLFLSDGKEKLTSTKPQSDLELLTQYKKLFNPPVLKPIERTIYVATPHRGSDMAASWIGNLGASLIKLPKDIVSLQLGDAVDSMTDFGRSLVHNDGKPNSISRLKPDNQALTLLNKQPMSEKVIYHSIIGDRGLGNSPDSSDGVVPYWSSHIEGAASEKIVPTFHEAQLHPETNTEILRILRLHLQDEEKK